jgi:hypothetical protein
VKLSRFRRPKAPCFLSYVEYRPNTNGEKMTQKRQLPRSMLLPRHKAHKNQRQKRERAIVSICSSRNYFCHFFKCLLSLNFRLLLMLFKHLSLLFGTNGGKPPFHKSISILYIYIYIYIYTHTHRNIHITCVQKWDW